MVCSGVVSARGVGAWWRVASVLTLLLALLVTAAGVPAPTTAATLTVMSGADSGGTCPGVDCTLRQAIAVANANDTITFAAGVTTVTLTTGDQFGALDIFKNLTIQGSGVGGVTIQRSSAEVTPNFRIFFIEASATVTLQGLTIRNANTSGGGAGIFNLGTLNLIDSVMSDNTAHDLGGGIYNTGSLTISGSTFSGNDSIGEFSGSGGAIYTSNTTQVTDSAFVNNSATGSGGAISTSQSTLTATGSTFSGNSVAAGYGGALNLNGPATLTNSTISGNSASSGGGIEVGFFGVVTLRAVTLTLNEATDTQGQGGGGIFVDNGTVSIFGSIVAGNSAANSADCMVLAGTFTSAGYNVVGSGSDCPTGGTADATHTGALGTLLNATLADNGGPTQTHALVTGSAALDRVPTNQCAPIDPDQRGIDRPQGSGCDSGAFEARTFVLTNIASGPGVVTPGTSSYLEGSVVAMNADPDDGASFLRWTQDNLVAGNDNPFNVTVDSSHTIVGIFGYNLTITTSGTGTVDRNPSGTGLGPFAYVSGTEVELTPHPDTGQTFVGWVVDDVYAGWAVPLTITMDAAHTVQ
ncbi:MAG: choice-of-anchor Q domain-containing protein, partial [Chloroflexia bacterium]